MTDTPNALPELCHNKGFYAKLLKHVVVLATVQALPGWHPLPPSMTDAHQCTLLVLMLIQGITAGM